MNREGRQGPQEGPCPLTTEGGRRVWQRDADRMKTASDAVHHVWLNTHKIPRAEKQSKATERASGPDMQGAGATRPGTAGVGVLWQLMVKNVPANAGDKGPIPDLGRAHGLRRNQDRASQVPELLGLCSGNNRCC